MSYQKVALRLALIVASAFCASAAVLSQEQQDPSSKPRNVKPELKKAYKDWLDKDVTYIITDEERKAFKKLATDDERERFIEEFWRRRDPDPDTEENEFKEEYYERIAYANAQSTYFAHYSVTERYETLLSGAKKRRVELVPGHEDPFSSPNEFLVNAVVDNSATAVIT